MCFATYFLHIRSFFSPPISGVEWKHQVACLPYSASRAGLCCQNLSMSGGERPHIRYTIYGTSVHNRSSCCQVPFRLDLSSKNSSFRPLTRKIGNSPISDQKSEVEEGGGIIPAESSPLHRRRPLQTSIEGPRTKRVV